MNINPDYMAVMRTGARITRSQFKKEQEAGHIIFVCIIAGAVIVLAAVILI